MTQIICSYLSAQQKKLKKLSLLLICIFSIQFIRASQTDSLTALVNQALKTGNWTEQDSRRCATLIQLYGSGKVDSVAKYYHLAMEKSHKIQYFRGIGVADIALGIVLWRVGLLDSAETHLLKAIDLFKSIGNDTLSAVAMLYLGNSYADRAMYSTAARYYHNLYNYMLKIQNREEMAVAKLNMGTMLTQLFQFEEAEEHYWEAIELFQEANAATGVAFCYEGLATNFKLMEDWDKALAYYLKAYKIYQKTGYTDPEFYNNYFQIAQSYGHHQQYDSAIYYYNIGKKIVDSLNYRFGISHSMATLAHILLSNGRYEEGLEAALASLQNEKQVQESGNREYAYIYVSRGYERVGDYKNAYLYSDSALQIRTNVLKNALKNGFMESKLLMDMADKELENEKLRQEEIRKVIRLRFLLLLFATLGVAILFISLIVIRARRQKAKIQLKQAIGQARIEARDEQNRQLSHRLHGVLQDQLSEISAILKDNKYQENQQALATHLDAAKEQVRSISYDIFPPVLNYLGLKAALSAQLEKIEKDNAIQTHLFVSPKFPKFRREAEFTLYYLIKGALTNCIQHAQASQVYVSLTETEQGEIILSIEDDGVGFEVNTANYGIGIDELLTRANILGGKLNIESKIGKGTAISLYIKSFSHLI